MKIELVISTLSNLFESEFKKYEISNNKKSLLYDIKVNDLISNEICFYFHKYGNEFGLNISLHIKSIITQKVFTFIESGKNKKMQGNTLWYGPYTYKGAKIQPVLAKKTEDVHEWFSSLIPFIKDKEKTFFIMTSLNQFDEYFNSNLDEELEFSNYFYGRAIKGIITAKINSNPNFIQLCNEYKLKMKNAPLLESFEKYVTYLQGNSIEEILKDIKWKKTLKP